MRPFFEGAHAHGHSPRGAGGALRKRSLPRAFFLPIVAWLLFASTGHAHFLNMTRCLIEVDAESRAVSVDLSIDFTRLLQDPVRYFEVTQLPENESAPIKAELVAALQEKLQLLHGETVIPLETVAVNFPDLPLEKFTEPWAAPMADVTFAGTLPPTEGTLTLRSTHGLAIEYPLVATLRTTDVDGASFTRWLEPGQRSPSLPFAAAPSPLPAPETEAVEAPESTSPSELRDPLPAVIGRYLVLGFEHILPKGLDHILFVLGLFFLSAKRRPLLLQVSVFTLAHTLTLGLTALGWLPYLPNVVEPLIALSIAYVGIENIWRQELKRSRVVIVFAFGLIHGMGFAGMLNAIGMPAGELLAALVAFNLGVEAGQLAVILLAALATFRFQRWRGYRGAIQIPASLGISLIALWWFFQRIGAL